MDRGCKRFICWLLSKRDQQSYLPTGSFFERPFYLMLSDLTDIDFLVSPDDLIAIPPGETVPSYFRSKPRVLTICTNDVHAGFAKLVIDNNDNQFFQRPYVDREDKTFVWEKKVKGPSVMKIMNITLHKKASHFVESLSQYDSSWNHITQFKRDEVEAIYCPYWPPEAAEWVTRKRDNHWPSKRDIYKVVNGGCHFVAKPHQSNPNDATQWRFSFSQAELILIHSWTDVQMQIYHLLRLVKSEVVKSCGGEDSTVLSTYFFKTLMFWACEEKPREFWEEMNLETSVVELIVTMVEWLIDRICPNYFIPGNNMIDYLSDNIDLSKEIEFLLHQRENCVRSLLNKMPKTCQIGQVLISISNKVLFYLQLPFIYGNAMNPLDGKTTIHALKHITDSKQFLYSIKYLHLGILSHLKTMNLRKKCLSESFEYKFAVAASGYLEKAMTSGCIGNYEVSVSLSDSLITLCEKLITRGSSQSVCSPDTEIGLVSNAEENSTLTNIARLMLSRWIKDVEDYLPSPWFMVAASYRANFLFTCLMDYKVAIKVCNEGTCWAGECKNHSLLSEPNYAFRSLPFIITSEWCAIFDKQVQIVFGFVSLYRKIFKDGLLDTRADVHSDEGNVVLRLCTEQFLNYISCRCQRRLGFENVHMKRTHIMSLKFNPFFTERHFQDFSNFFLNAAAHVGFGSDYSSNQNGDA